MRYLIVLGIFFVFGCANKKTVSEVVEENVEVVTEEVEEVVENTNRNGQKVSLMTDHGQMVILLYDETPGHRDNFLKLVSEGFYEDLLFHRVIKSFMIQGGDPNSRDAAADARLGSGGPGYTIPAEFNKNLIHKKGALAAARNNNPQKESSGSQFYIVQGKKMTDAELDGIQGSVAKNMPGFTYSAEQREIYKTVGGTPFLDMNYTVFGEVLSGFDVIDAIAAEATAPGDRPLKDIKMSISKLK